MKLELEVRDYELDYQSVVNNSIYLNYFEHARSIWLKKQQLNLYSLHDAGFDLMLHDIKISYLQSLRAYDKFTISTGAELLSPVRLLFKQEIQKESGLVSRAESTVVCLYQGKLTQFGKALDLEKLRLE